MLDGANAGRRLNLIGAGNPNAAAVPHIRPEVAGERALFRPGKTSPGWKCYGSGPKERRLMSWTEIKVK